MHSRIIEISKEKKEESEYRSINYYANNPDVMHYCDYITKSSDREQDIAWFMSCLPDGYFKLDGNCITMIKKPIEFAYEILYLLQDSIYKLTLKDICTDYSSDLHKIISILTNKFNTFVVDDRFNDTLLNYKQWICQCCNDEVGTKYYICSIIDYHF